MTATTIPRPICDCVFKDDHGLRNGMALIRDGLSVYIYLTDSGKTVVAYVSQKEND